MRCNLNIYLPVALLGATAPLCFAQSEQPHPTETPAPSASSQDPAHAAPQSNTSELPDLDDGWRFKLAPYLWIPAQDGDITVRGNSAPVDLSVADTFDTITDKFNVGLTLRGEATRKQWSILADIMYLSLEVDDTPLPAGPASVRQDQGIFEFAAAYDVSSGSLSNDSGEHAKFSFAPLGGVRIHYLSLELEPSGAREVSRDKGWVDAFIGVRGGVSFTESFSIFARADVGAGGSDFTWNALAGVEYRFNSWGSLLAGYRGLDIDYSDGSGADAFSYDMLLHGPFIAMEVRF
jgi:hypothetical protein